MRYNYTYCTVDQSLYEVAIPAPDQFVGNDYNAVPVPELRTHIHLQTVIIYVSFSQRTQHEWSDIDVALVSDEFTGFYFDDAKFIPYMGFKQPYPYTLIEAKTYPPGISTKATTL